MILPKAINQIVVILFFVNITLTILELFFDYINQVKRDRFEDKQSFIIGILYNITEELGFGIIGLYALSYLSSQSFNLIFLSGPLGWIISIFLADLTYYIMHRTEHKVGFLWCYHATHHNSSEYNLLTGYRLSFMEHLIEWIFLAPLILLGLSPEMVIGSMIIVAQYQHWIHTKKVIRIPLFDKIFNSPSPHRVHHASNEGFLDKNFGGITLIWDHLFGTYQDEVFDVKFGITRNVDTKSLFDVLINEWRIWWREKNGS